MPLPRRALALLALVVLASACVPPPPAQSKAPLPGASAAEGKSPPGRDTYERAKQAIFSGDTRGAKALLEQATREDAQVCEYWYQLGACESNLAVEVVDDSESEALRLFTDAVDHKREALRLMDEGKCRIWTDPEREQARADGQAGLADSEAVLRDPASLVIALKMHAAQRGL